MAMAAVASSALPVLASVPCAKGGRVAECRSRVDFVSSATPLCRLSREPSVWSVLTGRSLERKDWRWHAVAEQLQAQAESDEELEEAVPADTLAMHFEAEGTISDSAIPKLTKTLESVEGVSDVELYVSEGGATVKLVKQMNVQSTGVASGLVEIITKGGFKLHALNLAFDEDGNDDEDLYDYDMSSYEDEGETVVSE